MEKTTLVKAEEARRHDNFRTALALYENIIQQEPDNALAYQGAAYCLYKLGRRADAFGMSGRALAINSGLMLPHVVMAQVYDMDGNVEKGYEEAQIALQLAPDSSESNYCYGTLLLWNNRTKESIPYLTKAVEIDPVMYSAQSNLAAAFALMKQYKQYAQQRLKMFKLKSTLENFVGLIFSYMDVYRYIYIFLGTAPFLALVFHAVIFLWIASVSGLLMLLASYYLFKRQQRDSARRYFLFALLIAIPTLLIYLGMW